MNKTIRNAILWASALAAAAGLALAGCGQAAATAPAAAISRPAGPTVPVLAWKPCDGGFRCATAQVPLNYTDPRGATISIAVISHPATGPGPDLGWLFLNGGGPNPQVSTMSGAYSSLPAAWRAHYNLITFDPRGMGYSSLVRCFPTEAAENKLLRGLPAFPVGAAQQAAWDRAYAQLDAQCDAHAGPLLDHDSTADIARDMNLLRQAVGEPVLNYYGQSYATLLGAVYANLFPATTGRMILDGNVNPVAWSTGSNGVPAFARLGSPQASAATMAAFLDLCGKAPAAGCAFSAGTPAATAAKWNALLRRLRRHPVTVGSPAQTYTYADAVASIPLDAVAGWQAGATLLQQLWTASSSAPATPSSASPSSSSAGGQSSYTGVEQKLAMFCADSPNPRDPVAYAAAAARSTFAPTWAWTTEGCADWPAAAAQDRYTGPWDRPTASTILLLANTGDPATAYQDSVAMSRDLARARLVTVNGYGHTTGNNPSTCAINDAINYTLTGALPAPGTVCQQGAAPFPAS